MVMEGRAFSAGDDSCDADIIAVEERKDDDGAGGEGDDVCSGSTDDDDDDDDDMSELLDTLSRALFTPKPLGLPTTPPRWPF